MHECSCRMSESHSDNWQKHQLLFLSLPISASNLKLLLFIVRFMHQACYWNFLVFTFHVGTDSYWCMSSLPLLGILYELPDRSVSRPSPPCNNRDPALPWCFWQVHIWQNVLPKKEAVCAGGRVLASHGIRSPSNTRGIYLDTKC